MNISSEFVKEILSLGNVKIDEPLSRYTTFKTGGKGDILFSSNDKKSLSKVVSLSKEKGIPLTIIGGGSNLLVGDKGIRGIVIKIAEDDIESEIYLNNDDLIYSDASVKKENFINFALSKNFMGIEFMAGLPGCIGGGIVMNAGTNMGTFVDILKKVEYIDRGGEMQTVDVSKEMSAYRKLKLEEGSIVTAGYFKLIETSNIKKIRDDVNTINEDRKIKHPLDYPSAGSVFLNPKNEFSWKLIDDTGLKGKTIGGAMVSEKHTNFIINYNNATSKDIKNLIEYVQEKVYNKFKIKLETEIRMIGEF